MHLAYGRVKKRKKMKKKEYRGRKENEKRDLVEYLAYRRVKNKKEDEERIERKKGEQKKRFSGVPGI